MAAATDSAPSVHFYFDASCPWAYVTSRWAQNVASARGFTIRWRFFSLRAKNAPADLDPEARASFIGGFMGHRCLRVAAAVRESVGDEAVGRLYNEMGRRRHASGDRPDIGAEAVLSAILAAGGLEAGLATAVDDEKWDAVIEADMAEGVAKAGDDVGVPIIVLDDGEGPAWFGPVVSRAPQGDEALALWDAFETLARVPYAFEMKRRRNERPQLAQFA